jgi:uncharacterized protein YjbI with pentapeptide repeats
MRLANGVAALALMLAVPGIASGGGLPNYTTPGDTTAAGTETTQLTARDVTEKLFKAAPGSRPDLHQRSLARLDLAELDFKHANLSGSDLYGADLTRAKLTGVSLIGARLDRATLTSTDFSGADLTDARIFRPTIFTTLEVETGEAPKFIGAKLVRMRSDGMFERADFSDADLTGAVLGRSAAREPSVNAPASLSGANFTRAILKEAKLSGTSLSYARFIGADLRGANLRGTNLTRADFTGADLTGADVTGANLDEADLRGARGLDQVTGLATATNIDSAQRDPIP